MEEVTEEALVRVPEEREEDEEVGEEGEPQREDVGEMVSGASELMG